MASDHHPVDAVTDDLVDVYRRGARRLENIVGVAIRRGLDPSRVGRPDQARGDATLAYRARQLVQARAVLDDLERHGRLAASAATARAWEASAVAYDVAIGSADAGVAFGTTHRRQLAALAGNLERSLTRAAQNARANVELVFARADALAGPLPPAGINDVAFLGRRHDDPWRRLALETVGQGRVNLDTWRQIKHELARRLVADGVTDALTGFVDAGGRRWALDTYADMVARTTGREASSRAVVARAAEHGTDLIKVSSHPHAADICTPYDGHTFSLSNATPGYPILDQLPPFHPRCRHVLGPAGDNLDRYEAELERQVRGGQPEHLLEPPRQPAPPLSVKAAPSHDPRTAARLEAQRINALIAGDPGPEPGYLAALERELHTNADALKREERRRVRALNLELGDSLKRELGKAWAKRDGWREQLLAGDASIADFEDAAVQEFHRLEAGRVERERQRAELRNRPIPCFVCGRLKRRPADVCDYCGDDPVTYGGSAESFNRNFGYSS